MGDTPTVEQGDGASRAQAAAIRAREAQLSRERQGVVWLLIPLTLTVLGGLYREPFAGLCTLAYAAAAAAPAGYASARMRTDGFLREICGVRPRTVLARLTSPQFSRLLAGAWALGIGMVWIAAGARLSLLREILVPPDADVAFLAALLAEALLVAGVVLHWLESRDWRSRGRLALMQLCDTDPHALMRDEGSRWAWWWGWREAWGMARQPDLDGLADYASNVALALAALPFLGAAVASLEVATVVIVAPAIVLDVAVCPQLVALPLSVAAFVLSSIWPSAWSGRKSVMAVMLSFVGTMAFPLHW